jgi:hypothetical protein
MAVQTAAHDKAAALQNSITPKLVMPGLVPGIHVLLSWTTKAWMAGTSPAMTEHWGN